MSKALREMKKKIDTRMSEITKQEYNFLKKHNPYAKWLSEIPVIWTHFGTSTSRHYISEHSARSWAQYIHRYFNEFGGNFFWVAEKHRNGSNHLHWLVSAPYLKFDLIRKYSNSYIDGFTTIKKVKNNSHKAIGYVSKYCMKNSSSEKLVDYDIYLETKYREN